MTEITEILNTSWIEDLAEISMLENFFQDQEIKDELEKAEKNRKKRQLSLIIIIPLVFFGSIFLYSLWIIPIEIGENTGNYRPSEWFDWLWLWFIISFVVFGLIVSFFRKNIEWAIKQKVLAKLSKKVYENLEYDETKKYAFNNIKELINQNFLKHYETIDKIEDSLAFTLKKDWKLAIIQWYELETSEMQWSWKNRRRVVTNHCYLLKTRIPNARIKLYKNLFIRTDVIDSSKGLIWNIIFLIIGWLFVLIFSYIFTQSYLISLLISVAIISIIIFISKKYSKPRVKLENIEFEKMFDVHCEDQIWSRMIITPAFMDRLVTFAKKSKYQYEFLFTPECFYIKWNVSSNYLEVNTWKKITENMWTFIEWYLQMKNIVSLIIDMQILYLSKTDTSFVNNDNNFEYETFDLEIWNNIWLWKLWMWNFWFIWWIIWNIFRK